ncbi:MULTISPECIES: response regulator transcription factor [Cellulomonas]|uniref:DNA-binding response OmpR family regulator n=1 Tax=Cellulomonas oligotrophica TaxID=931536 RepID=A0A7Y9JY79_9CELL|nr:MULTISPECIES: response regulator transcription factor [Cellulomonas]NYD85534.1 DNA-binding response OmpR family regulator [Cellulomonas oligotrophica]TQL03341.1 DNA-binding response OmpR family regulator [Cellulomonas sp. SLBN-39]GIG31457.1 DNA-binding response regulator [Cellulomonas oligotrophica]
MTHILIAEDEERIAAFVSKGLRAHGYETTCVPTGEAALERVEVGGVDLLVLDLGLGDMDGFDVLRMLRAEGYDLPVVVLTARSSVTDTVTGLESGADDYMAKPFRFEELLARIRLRLRTQAPVARGHVLSFGRLALDLRTRRMRVDEREVDLSAREFALAEMFMRNPGEVLTRERLLADVWGFDFDPGSNVVDVYVRYLRRKLGAEHFDTIRGVGYRMVDTSPDARAGTAAPARLAH